MKKAILVTGVAGSGKSSVAESLRGLGYESYDIEEIDGMFEMYRKGTREVFENYKNTPEQIKNADWVCHEDKLKELLSEQQSETAFYCGVASNLDDIVPLFNNVVLLKASPETIYGRLSNREGTDDIGSTEESRQTVLDWKAWWEDEMEKRDVTPINADGIPGDVAKRIVGVMKESTDR